MVYDICVVEYDTLGGVCTAVFCKCNAYVFDQYGVLVDTIYKCGPEELFNWLRILKKVDVDACFANSTNLSYGYHDDLFFFPETFSECGLKHAQMITQNLKRRNFLSY